jgi:hypothetical protein
MSLFTSPPLNGPGFAHSTRDRPSSTRLRAIEAKTPRPILESSRRQSAFLWVTAGRAASDDLFVPCRNRLAISPRFPHAMAPRITGAPSSCFEGKESVRPLGAKSGSRRNRIGGIDSSARLGRSRLVSNCSACLDMIWRQSGLVSVIHRLKRSF